MSLQVWLPLNGNLNNQGLISDLIVANGSGDSAAAVDNSGKIGKCYSFDGSNDCISLDGSSLRNLFKGKDYPFSIAFWIYHADSTRAVIMGDYNFVNSAPYFNIELTTSHTLRFYWYGGTATTGTTVIDYNFGNDSSVGLNTWTHIILTYNGGTEILCYKNGNLLSTKPNFGSSAGLRPKIKTTNGFYLGRDSRTGTTVLNGKLNDFRIYDHCLSLKEVEEIAKGLVLHYKLDQNFQQLIDSVTYSTFNTSYPTGNWSHWKNSSDSVIASYGQNTNSNYIYRNNQTYSHWWYSGDGATADYFLYKTGPNAALGTTNYRSMQGIFKEENGLPIKGLIYPNWNKSNSSLGAPKNKWSNIVNLGNGFYLCQVNGLYMSEADTIGVYVKAGYKVYCSELHIENDKMVCSDLFNQDNLITVYDSSGYNNHGTVNGTLSAAANSPRYDVATQSANGADNYILGSELPSTCQTVSIWIKTIIPTTSTAYKVIFAEGNSDLEITLGQSVFYVATQNSSTSKTGFSNLLFNNDKWNHLVLVKINNTTKKLYINGQEATISGLDYFRHDPGPFMLFRRSYNTNYAAIDTQISDMRIYTTALSAAAIKELYETSASIDASGNIYARELKEV